MVVKAGPKGEWHCQPDNGTFELWVNGRNLFPDSGSYIYAGHGEVMKLRNWFRRTATHNTLTLDGKNLETTQSVTKFWKPEGDVQILVTENPSYADLKHRRTVFFVDQKFFVIVDEAVGTATGTVNLNYHLAEGEVSINKADFAITTSYEGDSNVKLQCFPEQKAVMNEVEGWRSTAYRKRVPRKAVTLDVEKKGKDAVRYISVIYPVKNADNAPKIYASFSNKHFQEDGVEVTVMIDGKKFNLAANLQE